MLVLELALVVLAFEEEEEERARSKAILRAVKPFIVVALRSNRGGIQEEEERIRSKQRRTVTTGHDNEYYITLI
jgi:hypothetical protein